ncbi:MAG: hypothetical protein AAFP69_12480 [Planctomycetota bacterium]
MSKNPLGMIGSSLQQSWRTTTSMVRKTGSALNPVNWFSDSTKKRGTSKNSGTWFSAQPEKRRISNPRTMSEFMQMPRMQ